ncbi:MAG: cytochrome c oxidase subunit II [Terriglobia bacterium]
MKKIRPEAGSALVPALLALILVALTFSTIYIFAVRQWWFPKSITPLGADIDRQFDYTLIITGIVFLLAQLALGYVILRYPTWRGGRATYSHGNNTLEILWTAATAIMFLGLGIAAERAWAQFHFLGAAPGALQVEVTGQQFQWNIRYPGPDRVFGRTDPRLVNDAAGEFLGLDSNDPAAQDDIVTPIMAVPVNRPVEVILRSKDVTHSFFVPELRFKQDTVPGMVIRLHFTATQVGKYEVACAELCGLGHHRMRTDLRVLSEDEFRDWLREQKALM